MKRFFALAICVLVLLGFMPPHPARGANPTPTPSGVASRRIAFAGTSFTNATTSDDSAGFTVYTIDPTNSDVRKIGQGRYPQWSPDGKYLAFSTGDLLDDVSIAQADGSSVRSLGPVSAYSWSANGQHFAYTAAQSGFYMADADGQNAKQLLTSKITDFVWLADNQSVVVVLAGDLYLTPIGSKKLKRLAVLKDPPTQFGISPDGKRLTFFINHNLYMADSDGKNLHELIAPWDNNYFWSPDGAHIAFFTPTDSGDCAVWLITGAGLKPHPVGQFTSYNYPCSVDVQWSPDGKYVSCVEAMTILHVGFLLDVSTETTVNKSSREYRVWSSDGTRMVLLHTADDGGDWLEVTNADGSGRHLLNNAPEDKLTDVTW